MKTFTIALALLAAQDGKKWKPFEFAGNEKFEYKVVQTDNDEKKESGFLLDLRKKGDEQLEVTVSHRSILRKDQGAEIVMSGGGAGMLPLVLFNPGILGLFQQVELKEGEKMAILGFGVIKVGKKETIGGRSGFPCTLIAQQDGKDVASFQWTIDPELGLPIRSITYEEGKEKIRADLLSYKKD
ncbi:MAG TPA: hypothetical protein VF950_14845 [Planctomycetota bacterium]